MSKHLPPPKNKHVKEREKPARRTFRLTDLPEISIDINYDKRRGSSFCYTLSKKELASLAVAFVMFAAILIWNPSGWMALAAFAVPTLLAGIKVIQNAADNLLRKKFLAEEVVTVFVCICAFAIGKYLDAAAVMLFFHAVRLLETYISEKGRNQLTEINLRKPKSAHLETENGREDIDPEDVVSGDTVFIDKEEMIPVDGIICEGFSSVDDAYITGSSKVVAVAEGSAVYAGCINTAYPLYIRAEGPLSESKYIKLYDSVREAYDSRSDTERRILGICAIGRPIFILLSVVFAIVLMLSGKPLTESIYKTLILLTVSCSSSLLMPVSQIFKYALCTLAMRGIYLKNAVCVEKVAASKTFIFDKSGTITEKVCIITEVYPRKTTKSWLLSVAAMAESRSDSPIAMALRQSSECEIPEDAQITDSLEIPGRGICATVNGQTVIVGNAAMLQDYGVGFRQPEQPGTAVHVAVEGVYMGCFLVSSKIKDGAFDAIEGMRASGVDKTVLLTGDVLSVTRKIAASLNFDMIKSELVPNDKISAVEYLMATKNDGTAISYVCSGNRSLDIMTRADVGISMDSLDSSAAFDSAKVFAPDCDIRTLPELVEICAFAKRAVKLDIYVVLALKALLIVLALLGAVSLNIAVLMDAAVTALAGINAVRVLKINTKKELR